VSEHWCVLIQFCPEFLEWLQQRRRLERWWRPIDPVADGRVPYPSLRWKWSGSRSVSKVEMKEESEGPDMVGKYWRQDGKEIVWLRKVQNHSASRG
jgi:hypothetical protein